MRVVLDTRRLTLREMGEADLDFVAEMLGHPEVMRFWPRPLNREEALAWIRRQEEGYARHGHAYWLALDRAGGTPVGQVGLLMCAVDGVEEPSLGYILHRPYWGRGLATEAGAECLRFAREALGCRRVTCLVRPENIPSLRVAVRLGLLPEKHVEYKGFAHLVFTTPAVVTSAVIAP